MKECANTYFVTVIEDLNTNKIIGAATLVVEHKFIHRCSKVHSLKFRELVL
mgnify:FL=1